MFEISAIKSIKNQDIPASYGGDIRPDLGGKDLRWAAPMVHLLMESRLNQGFCWMLTLGLCLVWKILENLTKNGGTN